MHDNNNSDRSEGSDLGTEGRDHDFEMLLGSLDAASLRPERSGACPPLRDLMSAADHSMDAEGRKRIDSHVEECPSCACLMMEISWVSAPIALFHESSLFAVAWQHMRSGGRLSPALEEAWTRHRRQCSSCENRAGLLSRFGVRREQQDAPVRRRPLYRLVPAGAFGLGVALTALVMSRNSPMPVGDSPGHVGGTEPTERSVSANIPDSSSYGILDLMLRPTPSRLESTVETWDSLKPELNMQRSIAIGGIYLQEADSERDSDRKAIWLRRSEKELLAGRTELDRKLAKIRKSLLAMPDRPAEGHADDRSVGKE